MADDPMWCLVMFDLPVETKKQRREATRFRNDLLDWGFCMVQLSVREVLADRWAGSCDVACDQESLAGGWAGSGVGADGSAVGDGASF